MADQENPDSSEDDDQTTPKLKRAISLPLLIFYGVGTIVGGGFYALTGKVAGEAGMAAPIAFIVSATIALVTSFSFAELSARYPVSAGPAHYVRQGFQSKWLSTLIGWLVILTGIVSAAALANAFSSFLDELAAIPNWFSIAALVLALGLLAAWGIGESVTLAIVITLIELGGLLFLFIYASPSLATLGERWSEIMPGWNGEVWIGILVGAYLAFYSFIGFEDMVSVAEEVKQPEKTLPRAILISVIVTGTIYVLICLVVVLTVPPEDLANSKSPFSLVLADWPAAARGMTLVGMLAGVNGALIQVIMASRIAYGMGKSGQGPAWLNQVHPRTQTPIYSTIAVTLLVLGFALWLPIVPLAKLTSTILLIVFSLVNLSLVVLKFRKVPISKEALEKGCPNYPLALPLIGTITCAGLVIVNLIAMVF